MHRTFESNVHVLGGGGGIYAAEALQVNAGSIYLRSKITLGYRTIIV